MYVLQVCEFFFVTPSLILQAVAQEYDKTVFNPFCDWSLVLNWDRWEHELLQKSGSHDGSDSDNTLMLESVFLIGAFQDPWVKSAGVNQYFLLSCLCQVEFGLNAEAQKFLSKSGETLTGAINAFTSDMNTLVNKTIEDTMINAKQYEAARWVENTLPVSHQLEHVASSHTRDLCAISRYDSGRLSRKCREM